MTDKIEFLREYAKCGIYHNHGYHNSVLDDKLKMMNEAVKELQDLAEQLKQERNKAIGEAIEKIESLKYITNDHNERSGGRQTGYNESIDILKSLKH